MTFLSYYPPQETWLNALLQFERFATDPSAGGGDESRAWQAGEGDVVSGQTVADIASLHALVCVCCGFKLVRQLRVQSTTIVHAQELDRARGARYGALHTTILHLTFHVCRAFLARLTSLGRSPRTLSASVYLRCGHHCQLRLAASKIDLTWRMWSYSVVRQTIQKMVDGCRHCQIIAMSTCELFDGVTHNFTWV